MQRKRLLLFFGALLIIELTSAVPATASPVTNGSLTPVNFQDVGSPLQDGGTVSGSFTLNSAGTDLATWSITVSAGAGQGSGGVVPISSFTYDNTTTSAHVFNPSLSFGGSVYTTISLFTSDYQNNVAGGHSLGLFFQQIPTVIPQQGVALQICSDVDNPCQDTGSGIAISSGELIRAPTASAPFGVDSRTLLGEFLTVSDPPGSISLNFTATAVLIPVTPGPVPEPSTLLLIVGSGLASLLGARRRKAL